MSTSIIRQPFWEETVANGTPLYHVIVLSNFARGFDKYSRTYSKVGIPESTYPDQFFLLDCDELSVGVEKRNRLMEKLALPGNRLAVLETHVNEEDLQPNLNTGLGRWIGSPSIRLHGLYDLTQDGGRWQLVPLSVEEAMAESLRLLQPQLSSFARLVPRSLSVLPIARGCQAACPFCFSDASASAVQEQASIDFDRVDAFASLARARGAERFVITGGGEPGLIPHANLTKLISLGTERLGKSVLITNGHHLTKLDSRQRVVAFHDYQIAGLSVLAISRHHHLDETNSKLMNLMTQTSEVVRTWSEGRREWPCLRLRLTCVLQQGGVEDLPGIADYLSWASAMGVEEVCFKELYVSTSIESVYHQHAANIWSHQHQVPLSLVLEFAQLKQFVEVSRLPWGAPVFRGEWNRRPMQIAAYTEPSLLWERTHGIARSWNLMADGRCLVSLEDRSSELELENAG